MQNNWRLIIEPSYVERRGGSRQDVPHKEHVYNCSHNRPSATTGDWRCSACIYEETATGNAAQAVFVSRQRAALAGKEARVLAGREREKRETKKGGLLVEKKLRGARMLSYNELRHPRSFLATLLHFTGASYVNNTGLWNSGCNHSIAKLLHDPALSGVWCRRLSLQADALGVGTLFD
ncbi:uncharacterized protein LOC111266264 isoform X2 [Varroa jacobsoni]|uniref:uncharacterized protein LOC111266264 isoform X2 n=1 Tax=Varroa jacobsoni TaxID=62625 RepID=UPI000BF65303|nr:uncharacterized protein LOC111266264 isoform X2 [Varroa jacobsoni]